jgi:predicted esterase
VLSSAGGTLDGVTYEEIMTGGADPDAAVPMVIAFHGRGAAPEFMAPIVKDLRAPARIIIPQGIDTLGKYFAWWDTKSTGDQADLTAGMVRAAGRLAPFVEAIRDCRPTIGKPILAGHSQGGMLVLALAATKPESMDAAIAGSAWLPSGLWREGMAPVHLLHGSADTTVPYPRTRDMVEKLEALGNNWDLETIEGHGHGLSGSLKTRWLDRIDDAVAAQAQ